jgi:hypothetical protein
MNLAALLQNHVVTNEGGQHGIGPAMQSEREQE